MISRSLMAAAIVLLLTASADAQILNLTQRFQVLSSKDARNLKEDLNKAGLNGIRVVTGANVGGEEVHVLLEKDKDNGKYEYEIVLAGDMSKLEQQISRAAFEGYRLLSNTITLKDKRVGSGEIFMIMEKGPRNQGSYEYLLLDASLAATMQVTLSGAIDQGYTIVGMLKKGKSVLLVLEKQS